MGLAAPLTVGVLSFVAFLPALTNGFVAWDDGFNLYNNPHYRGLGWTQLRWMLTAAPHGLYIPVTWLSFGADYVIWSMNPFGYHLTSLLLHAGAAVLLYFVALRLLRTATGFPDGALRVGAAAAALGFGLHPLRVESVAWATERRDVLAGALFLLALLLHLACVDAGAGRGRGLRLASVGAFLLALGSKASVVTLPLVLLVLDVYPLRRLPAHPWRWARPAHRPVLIEKIPYLALAGAGALTTLVIKHVLYRDWVRAGPPTLDVRLGVALHSAWFYLLKTLVPVSLSPLYDTPTPTRLWDATFLPGALAVAALLVLALALARRAPAVSAAVAAYLVLLAPLSGFVPVVRHDTTYLQEYDRYSYLTCLPWALLVGGAVAGLAARGRRLGLAAVALGLAGLGLLAWQQTRVWHDTVSLWRQAVAANPACFRCWYALGQGLIEAGAVPDAVAGFEAGIRAKPDDPVLRSGLADALGRLGRWDEAADQYRQAALVAPGSLPVRNNLAAALLRAKRWDEAVREARTGLALQPTYVPLWITLGAAFQGRGEPAEAVPPLRRAVELAPAAVAARQRLVEAYVALGREDLASEHREWLAARAGQASTPIR
jgi:Flp pilus assembly protein TadD